MTHRRLTKEEIDALISKVKDKVTEIKLNQFKTDKEINKKVKDYNELVNKIDILKAQKEKAMEEAEVLLKEIKEYFGEDLCYVGRPITENTIRNAFKSYSNAVQKIRDQIILESTDSSFDWKEFLNNLTI